MKTFKINVPKSREDFVLELLQRFEFCKIEGVDKDGNKESLKTKKASPKTSEEDMRSLQMALERLNRARDKNQPVLCNFRFPTQTLRGSKDEIKVFTKIEDLQVYLTNYFRVKVDQVVFTKNQDEKQEVIDDFYVFIQVKDTNEQMTKILAGFADYDFSKKKE